MRATLRDVAKRAGVSTKTVSNFLHDYPFMRAETQEKVRRAIEELDYRPNITARNLRRGTSGLIALALPEVLNPYYAELAQYVVEEAERYQLTVLIDCTQGLHERERKVASGFQRQLIDGLILLPRSLDAEDLRQRPDNIPLVLLGERLSEHADCVAIDSRAAARTATEHLLSLGRRRVGVIGSGPDPAGVIPRRRIQGYREALETAGLPFAPGLVADSDTYTSEQGVAAMTRMLAGAERPDAVFCHNDLLALGALRALREHGLRVPEDVAVIGVDDIAAGRFSTPALSTIAPDKPYIARSAVRMLVERSAPEGQGPPRQITAGYTLVPRESTRPPRE